MGTKTKTGTQSFFAREFCGSLEQKQVIHCECIILANYYGAGIVQHRSGKTDGGKNWKN